MGYLQTFDLNEYIGRFNLSMYFESGLYQGAGFRYARSFEFKKYFGAEIIKNRADQLIEEFKNDSKVELYSGSSVDYLNQVLQKYPKENFLFWLDGHYPGEIYEDMAIDELLPLKRELDIIFKHEGNNVIIVDDLRIYEDAEYENGLLPEHTVGDKTGLIVPDKYSQIKLLRHEGYLILTPKENDD